MPPMRLYPPQFGTSSALSQIIAPVRSKIRNKAPRLSLKDGSNTSLTLSLLGENAVGTNVLLSNKNRSEDSPLSGKSFDWSSLFSDTCKNIESGVTGAKNSLLNIKEKANASGKVNINVMNAVDSATTPEEFGKGSLEGIASAEAANNAVSGANMIPLLAFGIPGDIAAALIMGAFLIQGITLGPVVFKENPVEIYAIYSANIFNLFLGQYLIKMCKHVVTVPKRLLFPIVLVVASAGAYALRGSLFDIQLVFIFGILGYFMLKNDIPTVPMLIGFILTPIFEENLRITLLLSSSHDLNIAFILVRPAFLVLLLIMIASAIIFFKRQKNK